MREIDRPPLHLVAPSLELLPQYEAALAAGWSPDTERDVSAEQLAAARRDPGGFFAELTRQDGVILLASGQYVPRLPSQVFWIDDGDFCGAISLRYDPGTDALPSYVSGHIGYAVVPWKRNRGYATEALRLMLDEARAVGLDYVEITAKPGNPASHKVITANGGRLVDRFFEDAAYGGAESLKFRIDL